MTNVSESMFYHMKSGRYLRKEPILATFIAMGAGFDEIQDGLRKAGFVLSDSLPFDKIIKWILENEPPDNEHKAVQEEQRLSPRLGIKRLNQINDVLTSLEMPNLGTRDKAPKKQTAKFVLELKTIITPKLDLG